MPVHLQPGPDQPPLPSLEGACSQSNAADVMLPLLAGRAGLEDAGAPTSAPHKRSLGAGPGRLLRCSPIRQ